MKKYFISLFFCTVALCSFAQDSVLFSSSFLPEKIYTSKIIQETTTEISYQGSKEFLDKVTARGLKNPTVQVASSKIETRSTTGKQKSDLTFPLRIEYVHTESTPNAGSIPDGTMIYGHGKSGSTTVLDSIVSDKLDETMKKTFLITVQSMINQSLFPQRTIKVGDEFAIQTPLSIPIGTMKLEMEINTIYKLTSIVNQLANFEVAQTYTMKTAASLSNMNGTGKGNGKLIYDIKNRYNLGYQLQTQMDVTFSVEQFSIGMKTKSKFDQTSTVN
jgi:hypothetical protein